MRAHLVVWTCSGFGFCKGTRRSLGCSGLSSVFWGLGYESFNLYTKHCLGQGAQKVNRSASVGLTSRNMCFSISKKGVVVRSLLQADTHCTLPLLRPQILCPQSSVIARQLISAAIGVQQLDYLVKASNRNFRMEVFQASYKLGGIHLNGVLEPGFQCAAVYKVRTPVPFKLPK